ncbi:hypothetical protein K0M31_008277 [Melipona bicolor]|uniref:Uncharacterized protein n=1 Tax=Melipona bicolor TaxID=60889 RepID=A0AA40FRB0_9HYME|nr:hypothetical protein K0M31_008277 [Melipona bicolor]
MARFDNSHHKLTPVSQFIPWMDNQNYQKIAVQRCQCQSAKCIRNLEPGNQPDGSSPRYCDAIFIVFSSRTLHARSKSIPIVSSQIPFGSCKFSPPLRPATVAFALNDSIGVRLGFACTCTRDTLVRPEDPPLIDRVAIYGHAGPAARNEVSNASRVQQLSSNIQVIESPVARASELIINRRRQWHKRLTQTQRCKQELDVFGGENKPSLQPEMFKTFEGTKIDRG